MDVRIENGWKAKLSPEFEKTYFVDLTHFVKDEYSNGRVYPPAKLIFNAFDLCPFDNVKVVIIGQDPYHDRRIDNFDRFGFTQAFRIETVIA